MSTNRSKDRSSLCSFMFVDGRHCHIPRRVDHPYLCAFPTCSGGSSDPAARRPRAPLSPFRQLRVRLRSQLRPRTSLLRRRPRSRKAQNRLHPRLPRPNPGPNPAYRPRRIHQRLRHRHLARNHPRVPRTVRQAHVPRSPFAKCPIASARTRSGSGSGASPNSRGRIGRISSLRIELNSSLTNYI
jgi:hypothetical protein